MATTIEVSKIGLNNQFASKQRLIDTCNAFDAEATRSLALSSTARSHEQLRRLDAIEHIIYDWFLPLGLNAASDYANLPYNGMFVLMDRVQACHRVVVQDLVKRGYPPWTFDAVVDAGEQANIKAIWTSLTASSFTIFSDKVKGGGREDWHVAPATVAELKAWMVAAFARLISRPRGRTLLKQVPMATFIFPLSEYIAWQIGMNADPNDLAVSQPRYMGKQLQRGTGCGGGITLSPGLNDADIFDFDQQKRFLLSPYFLGVGHELVHMAHYGRGTQVPFEELPVDPNRVGPPANRLPKEYGGKFEEFLSVTSTAALTGPARVHYTVEIPNGFGTSAIKEIDTDLDDLVKLNAGIPTENDLREEHGLGVRFGHGDVHTNPFRYPVNDMMTVTSVKIWAQANYRVLNGKNQPTPVDIDGKMV